MAIENTPSLKAVMRAVVRPATAWLLLNLITVVPFTASRLVCNYNPVVLGQIIDTISDEPATGITHLTSQCLDKWPGCFDADPDRLGDSCLRYIHKPRAL